MLTARTKTIERTGTGRQFPPSLASLSATKFSLQIYMELTGTTLHTIKKEPIRSQHREPYSFAPQHSRNVQLIAFYASSPVAHARESPIVDFAKRFIGSLEVNGNKGTNADVTKIAD